MKRQLLTCCLAICSLATMAQHDEWKNPEINAVNRAPMLRQSSITLLTLQVKKQRKLTKKTQVTF